MATIAFDRLFNLSPNAYMLLDRQFRYVAVNQAYMNVTASRREELIGRSIFDVFPDAPDRQSAGQLRRSFERVLATKAGDTLALIPYRVPAPGPDGPYLADRYWSATHTPVLDGAGEVEYILQHTQDVTELQRSGAAANTAATSSDQQGLASVASSLLRRAQQVQADNAGLLVESQRLRQLFEQAPGFIAVLLGEQHRFDIANRAYCELVGRRNLMGKTVAQALSEVVAQGFIDLLDRVFHSGEPYVGRHVRVSLQREVGRPAEEVTVDFIYQPIFTDEGRVTGIFIQGMDVTAEVQAQQELDRYREHLESLVEQRTSALRAAEAERGKALDALHQAQKMESLGKLTGGVAHDFNNLLQVIGGNLQLLERHLGANADAPPVHRRLTAALDAVGRGATLASQLLAFARRQPLQPQVIDLTQLLGDMVDLLQGSVGEGIELQLAIRAGLRHTFADPSQLENAILNLVVNARDAMRGQGRLVIEASNAMLAEGLDGDRDDVPAGSYVLISVADTGCGMPPSVVDQAFDPFFTTKSQGRGTGLGLSMVYGFAKQSGGHASIVSEEGAGTTIRLYLPVTESCPQAPAAAGDRRETLRSGSETVLVVEDDEPVRDIAVATLTDLGYRVLKASDAQAALIILQSGLRIDLLFTDVIMPGPLRSFDLARQARLMLPNLKVLFTSGYVEDAVAISGRLSPDIDLLSKPYRREDLARRVGQLLDRRAPPA